MVEEKLRYSDADLAEFKEIILAKIDKAKADLDLIKSAYMNDLNNGTDDTSPTFKAFEEPCQKKRTRNWPSVRKNSSAI
jgi:hypothetical protein